MFENPNRVKDPRRYIRQCLDRDAERSRRFTRFVKKLLLVSMALFQMVSPSQLKKLMICCKWTLK